MGTPAELLKVDLGKQASSGVSWRYWVLGKWNTVRKIVTKFEYAENKFCLFHKYA